MASVFLSYDREDAGKARSIATALEKVGHSVWWDMHVRGGTQFAKAIEQALREADAVVVLWSKKSVESAWVRDEAAAGRDTGKLIPVRLDAVEPPLGFRQYQTIDLSRWKGNRRVDVFEELTRAISGMDSHRSAVPPPALHARTAGRWAVSWLALAVTVVALAAGIWLIMRPNGSRLVPVVTVASADNSPFSQQLARDLFVKLGRLQAIDTNPIELVDQDAGRSPDFMFKIGGIPDARQTNATITLTGKDRALLWSKDFETPADRIGDLKQQVGLSAARVLECATQATSYRKLDQPTLKLFLNGCASLSEMAWTDFRSLVPLFRQVTKKAPDFEGGWAHLLRAESYVVGWEILPSASREAMALRKTIAEARRRHAQIPEAYWAEYLLSIRDLAKKASIIERAISAHPDHPSIVAVHSGFLQSVGRMREATAEAKRAAELSPLSPEDTSHYINVLGWAGRPDLALAELEKAEKIWPGARNLIDSRWRFHLRFGDPKVALQITRSGVTDYAEFESYLLARIDPSPQNVEQAVADARAQVGRRPRAMGQLVQTLVEFGRKDEAYVILEKTKEPDTNEWVDAVFRPAFREFRQDPRFMRIVKRFGFVDYWRTRGKWPDFCFEPDLPYDCKAEAAKLR